MKIHFCDLCNESVPQSDLDLGRARVLKGRVICSACERAMSHAAASTSAPGEPAAPADIVLPMANEPAPSASTTPPLGYPPPVYPAPAHASPVNQPVAAPVHTSSSPGLWMAAIALIATAGAIYVFDGRIDQLSKSDLALAQALQQQRSELVAFERNLAKASGEQAEGETRLKSGLVANTERTQQLSSDMAKLQQRAEQARDELKQALAQLREEQRNGSIRGEQRLDQLSHQLAQSEDAQRELRERLANYETAAEESRALAEAAAAKAPVPAAGNGAPAWQPLLANLTHDNPSMRWQAVDELGRTKDTAVIPHLTPLLRDSDLFVRMCAARVLGELGTMGGVPALIDALEDSEQTVRESAWNALRTLTGKDFKFDPQGNEADRQKKIKQWREWWKKEGDPQSGGSATPPDVKSGAQKS